MIYTTQNVEQSNIKQQKYKQKYSYVVHLFVFFIRAKY